MSTPSLASLLCRWEEAFREGRDLPAEELCPDRSELAAQLQQAIDAKRRLNAMLDAHGGETVTAAAIPPRVADSPAPDYNAVTILPGAADGGCPAGLSAPPGYEILGELGRGGMGVVYKARQIALNRVVALKMILAGGHAGPEEMGRFKMEAEAIARLQHPGIVQVFEVGDYDGKPFFSLEFCPGGGLDRKLTGTPLPPREAAQVVRSLCESMSAAHQANVMHRDLKPANVVVAADGTLKITDFGLARKLDEQSRTQSGAIMGSPSYMPPEQAQGKVRDMGPASDVYSLGAILYECLTGRPPFKADTAYDTLLQVVSQEPVPPRQLNARVPRDLETVCLKCLRKDPHKRYASAKELGDDLGRLLVGEPIKARPVGVAERATKWVGRNPALAVMAATIFVTLTAATVVSTLFALDARDQKKNAEDNERIANEKAEDARIQKERADEEAQKANETLGVAKDEKKRADDKAKEAKQNEETAKAETKRANEEKYRANLAAGHMTRLHWALRAWERHDMARAEAILDEVPSEFQQTFEYCYVRALCRRKAMTLRDHFLPVTAVAFSPDGSRIASGSLDNTLKVWDAHTGQTLLSFLGRTGPVYAVAYSPDGSRLVSGAAGKALCVWDARTGQRLLSLEGHTDNVRSVAFSPDGSRIVSASDDKTLKVWDASTGRPLTLKGHEGRVNVVAYSPDGSRVVSGSEDKTLKVWDIRTGQELFTLKGHTSSVTAVAYSPDGSRIVSGSSGGWINVWDARTGKEQLLSHYLYTESVTAVAFSPDGSRIVSGGGDRNTPGGDVKVWDARTGKELLTLTGHKERVTAVAFSPGGSRIVSGSVDNTLRVWDAHTGQDPLSLEKSEPAVGVAFSPDGSRIVSGGWDQTLKVWDARTGQDLLTLEGHTDRVTAVAYSPDGSRIVSDSEEDGTRKVWDAHTGKELLTRKGRAGMAFSADGSRGVSGKDGATMKVWDARTGQDLLTLKGHGIIDGAFLDDGLRAPRRLSSAVRAAAFSRDGSRIVSGSWDKTLKVWDAKSGQDLLTLKGHTGRVNAVAFSPDGSRIASGSEDGTLKLWDVRTGQELLTLEGHTKEGVTAVAFSPDGSRIASASRDGVKVWEARPYLLTLNGHKGEVNAVAFSPNGSRLASGSGDLFSPNELKVWDAETGQELLTLEGHTDSVLAVAFSPDSKRIFGEVGRKILSWDATSGNPLPDPPKKMPTSSSWLVTHGDRRAFADGNLVYIERPLSPDEGHVEAILRANRDRTFHAAERARLSQSDAFGATFHSDRHLALSPDKRPTLLMHRAGVLSAALKANPDDHHSARSLARQAVADFATIDDPKSLLAAIARHPHSPLDRLHGALLLRTGNARDAAVVLRAAVRHRQPDQPPIDELLLALALIKLDRPDEARQHLKTAATWMDNGTAPLRLTSLLGARPAGPLAALTAVAHVPDVRLNRLDPFTAHELYVLRREVEQALTER